MNYQQELSQDRYAKAVLAIRGKYTAAQLNQAARRLWLMEWSSGKVLGEQHLLQEAGRLLKEIA